MVLVSARDVVSLGRWLWARRPPRVEVSVALSWRFLIAINDRCLETPEVAVEAINRGPGPVVLRRGEFRLADGTRLADAELPELPCRLAPDDIGYRGRACLLALIDQLWSQGQRDPVALTIALIGQEGRPYTSAPLILDVAAIRGHNGRSNDVGH